MAAMLKTSEWQGGGEEQREVLRAGMGMGATEVLIGEG
jgi:hypothetical protein